MPLVIAFHGGGMTMDVQEAMSALSIKAEKVGFVAVYPQALSRQQDYVDWCTSAARCGDVAFIEALIEHLETHLSIDPARIFATGFSAGGGFAYAAGCELSQKVAAVAAVAGAYENYTAAGCKATRPLPIAILHGARDGAIPFEGTASRLSVPEFAQRWADRNECAAVRAEGQAGLTATTWQDCGSAATVALYRFEEGSHIWFQEPIPATDLLWHFFTEHSLPMPLPATPTPPPTETAGVGDRYCAPGTFGDELDSGGKTRHFRVHIPPGYEPGTPIPLVLSFHPALTTAREHESYSGMSTLADQAGFIVVYPQSLSATPSNPAGPGRWFTQITEANRDVAFVRDLIPYLQTVLTIDSNRIYANGFSNGATFVDLLSCELSGELAAIASVAGGYADPMEDCRPVRAMPVLFIHGTADIGVEYDGPGWAPAWVDRYGCDPEPDLIEERAGYSARRWKGCNDGAVVTVYTIDGGGHIWFHEPVSATDLSWELFLDHPMP
jgi:polyhydroxybutyrate depolymerase